MKKEEERHMYPAKKLLKIIPKLWYELKTQVLEIFYFC